MAVKHRISNAEWLIMNVIWDKSPVMAKEIIQTIAPKTGWNPKTVKSLINRLVLKKKIRFTKQGRNYLYHPIASKDGCVGEEQAFILNKTFENSPKDMIISLIKNCELSISDSEEIRSALESSTNSNEKGQKRENMSLDVCLL
jgi:BlaI family penicillinase repressor